MQLLGNAELTAMGISSEIREYLLDYQNKITSDPDYPLGFNAGIYYDHLTGTATLAFAGTSDDGDWSANIQQYIGYPSPQYTCAMNVASALLGLFGSNQNYAYLPFSNPVFPTSITITGHSLGGGLARTAMYVTGFTTRTFNSAGLDQDTINDASEARADAGYPELTSSPIIEYVTENDPLYQHGLGNFGANSNSITILEDENWFSIQLEPHRMRQIIYGLMCLYVNGE